MTISLALKFLLLGQLASKTPLVSGFRSYLRVFFFGPRRCTVDLLITAATKEGNGPGSHGNWVPGFLGVPWNCNLLVIDHRKTFPKHPKHFENFSKIDQHGDYRRPVFMFVPRFFFLLTDGWWIVSWPRWNGTTESLVTQWIFIPCYASFNCFGKAVGYIANRSADWIDWIDWIHR